MPALAAWRLSFCFATIEAVHLLGAMRAENKLLRDAALERTNHLESIRSSVLLTHTYLGDYLLDSDQQKSDDYLAKMQDAWSRLRRIWRTIAPAHWTKRFLVHG